MADVIPKLKFQLNRTVNTDFIQIAHFNNTFLTVSLSQLKIKVPPAPPSQDTPELRYHQNTKKSHKKAKDDLESDLHVKFEVIL